MNAATQQVITLKEYSAVTLPKDDFPESLGLLLQEKPYSDQVVVEFPHIGNEHKWTLKAQSLVGFIPLSPEVAIRIEPKVSIYNLFGMLEYAYTWASSTCWPTGTTATLWKNCTNAWLKSSLNASPTEPVEDCTAHTFPKMNGSTAFEDG